jgi:glycosyltransferase involved in cell wall biosynthesis
MSPKLLIVSDSPVERRGRPLNTGFAGVIRNLLPHWAAEFPGGIDLWGINYRGFPHDLGYDVFPASLNAGEPWASQPNLTRLANHIHHMDYTNVFFLQDSFLLAQHGMPQAIRELRQRKGTHFTYYFPVDAPLEPEWAAAIACMDAPVAYTEYGKAEALKALVKLHAAKGTTWPAIRVLPHGVNAGQYRPLNGEPSEGAPPEVLRAALRKKWFAPFFAESDAANDIVLLNVNQHNKRKALVNSLELVRALDREHPLPQGRWRLLLHANRALPPESTDLFKMGEQLGLTRGREWACTDDESLVDGEPLWRSNNPQLTEAQLCDLYHAADAVVSTTLGEGWGLSITEAAAAGCPVFVPGHTSCKEIAEKVLDLREEFSDSTPILTLPCGAQSVALPADVGRVRPCVNISEAAGRIANAFSAVSLGTFRSGLSTAAMEFLSWPRIAAEFAAIFRERRPVPAGKQPA